MKILLIVLVVILFYLAMTAYLGTMVVFANRDCQIQTDYMAQACNEKIEKCNLMIYEVQTGIDMHGADQTFTDGLIKLKV